MRCGGSFTFEPYLEPNPCLPLSSVRPFADGFWLVQGEKRRFFAVEELRKAWEKRDAADYTGR